MRAWARLIATLARARSIPAGLLSRPAGIDPSAAGRALARSKAERERDKRRAMTNAIRADLRAKGGTLPPIDWSKLS